MIKKFTDFLKRHGNKVDIIASILTVTIAVSVLSIMYYCFVKVVSLIPVLLF